MSGFVLHPEALTDLDEIWEYIAADNPGAGDGVLEEIYEAIRALVPFPQQGHRRSDLTSRHCVFIPYETSSLPTHRMKSLCPFWRYSMAAAILVSSPHFFVKGNNFSPGA